ncbi:MAG TPA: hypothetical protein VIK91_18110, partial [Nannocystis sp.]
MLARRLASALALAFGLSLGTASAILATVFATGCKGRSSLGPDPGAAQIAGGTWQQWLTLEPLVELARAHATPATVAALEKASALLREGKARSADEVLAPLADSEGRHWISVARADLAAIYFTVCIRGVAWRLVDLDKKAPPSRTSDYREDTKLGPGDIAVEAMLTNLDAAVAGAEPVLQTQAR